MILEEVDSRASAEHFATVVKISGNQAQDRVKYRYKPVPNDRSASTGWLGNLHVYNKTICGER